MNTHMRVRARESSGAHTHMHSAHAGAWPPCHGCTGRHTCVRMSSASCPSVPTRIPQADLSEGVGLSSTDVPGCSGWGTSQRW